MEAIFLIAKYFFGALSIIVTLISTALFLRMKWPAPVFWILKLYASALSPILCMIGVLSTIVGLSSDSNFLTLIGIYNLLIFAIHIIRVTSPPGSSNSFENAFGENWQVRISNEQKKYFLPSRTILKLTEVPESRLEQNIPFATIPGTSRKLLCDIWQPPENVKSSGLLFIYLHGGAWYILDKDVSTRPFFRHLAAQGHVIMDVAYRLAPETDVMGMVHDAKRAIVWAKENAGKYGISSDKIVVGGGSSGAHIALIAAYTSNNTMFTPAELERKDVSVSAAISLYGPADLKAMYFHLNQHLTTRSSPGKPKKAVPTQMPDWIKKAMGENYYRLGMDKDFALVGAIAPLLGGHPDECPETYKLFSPLTHVHSDCPPTLLIHGEHDIMVPVNTVRSMHTRLVGKKVKTVLHILPQTDHAFDLILPKISPSSHNAIYDVERFLALQSAVNS